MVVVTAVLSGALTLLVSRLIEPGPVAWVVALVGAALVGLAAASWLRGAPEASRASPAAPAPAAAASTGIDRPVKRSDDLDLSPLIDLSIRSALRQAALALDQADALGAGSAPDPPHVGIPLLLKLGHSAAIRAQELMTRAHEGQVRDPTSPARQLPLHTEDEPFSLREDIVACARALGFELGREVALRFGGDFPSQVTTDRPLLRLLLTTLILEVAAERDDGTELLIEVSHDDFMAPRIELQIAVSATGDATIGPLAAYEPGQRRRPRRDTLAALIEQIGGRLRARDGQLAVVFDAERVRRMTGNTLYGLGALEGFSVLVIDPRPIGRVTICEQLAGWRLAPTGLPSVEEGFGAARRAHRDNAPFDLILLAGFGSDQHRVLGELIPRLPTSGTIKIISLESIELAAAPLPAELQPATEIALRRLPNPPSPTELIKLLVTLLAPEPDAAEVPARSESGLSVLVAEDNPVNQTLLAKLLERHGHSVRVVANGADLVDRLWEAPDAYDVALVDIQMPVMDGLEATTVIRLREAQFKRPRIPIIAVTAHAMGGERERCLEAGMDGYLSKPISGGGLTALIDELVAERRSADEEAAAAEARRAAGSSDVFDRHHVLEIAAGDMEFLKQLVDIFAETAPALLDGIERHLGARESEGAYRAAHQLKGSISNFGAEPARLLAARIEELGFNGQFAEASALMDELRGKLDELLVALRALVQELVD